MYQIRRLAVVLVAVLGASVSSGSGCAPLTSSTAIREAEAAIDNAEKVQADKHAQYEYWAAVAYLTKAKTTDGYSEFQIAAQYANRAIQFANRAVDAAKENLLRQKILNERLQKRDATGGGRP